VTLDQCGDVVTVAQVLEIFHMPSEKAIRRAIKARKFLEPDLDYPMRWSRDRLRLWWTEGRRTGGRQVHHRIAG
jgi:hypothetical protein